MDINQIKEFVVLAQTCNYQAASEMLFTTSSTLSRHIARMESELECQLFDRTTRKVSLTKAGEIFLRRCKEIDVAYDAGLKEIKAVVKTPGSVTTVAYANNMRHYGVFDITYGVQAKNPTLQVRMLETSEKEYNSMLHDGTIDFAYSSRLDLVDRDVAHCHLCADRVILLLPKTNPLAQREILDIKDLKNERFVIHNFYHTSERFISECQKNGFAPRVKITTDDSYAAFNAVAREQGVLAMSEIRYRKLQEKYDLSMENAFPYITKVELIQSMRFHIYLLYMKKRAMTPAMKTYLNYVRKSVNSAGGGQF